jgi:hypothetical protein
MKIHPLTLRIGHIIGCWNDPKAMTAMLNNYATGWHGDAYALAQKFPTDSANKTR